MVHEWHGEKWMWKGEIERKKGESMIVLMLFNVINWELVKELIDIKERIYWYK